MRDGNTSDTAINTLLNIMSRLRDPETGCPWDAKQTMSSLTRYTIEEAYEVVDAIEKGNIDDIRNELGDLLFQVVFYAQIAQENKAFAFADVATAISEKLVRRHPHVFESPARNLDDNQLAKQWDAIKAQEKQSQDKDQDFFSEVPSGLPALMYAQKIQKQCAKVGFDWPTIGPVLEKVREEIDEIQQELDAPSVNQQALEEEIGDAFFALVNVSRHANVDADTALRKASKKFEQRFNQVNAIANENQTPLQTLSLEQMEALWISVKQTQAK